MSKDLEQHFMRWADRHPWPCHRARSYGLCDATRCGTAPHLIEERMERLFAIKNGVERRLVHEQQRAWRKMDDVKAQLSALHDELRRLEAINDRLRERLNEL